MAATVEIKTFGLLPDSDRTIYATWDWSKENTDHYQVRWWYGVGDVGLIGSDTTTEHKQDTFNAPANADRVSLYVKPISKTHTVNDQEVSYWTADWSTKETYYFKDSPPTKPSAPTITIDKYKLTAELDNLDVNGDYIQFQVVKNNSTVFKTGISNIVTNHASYTCTIDAGNEYKVRCRAARGILAPSSTGLLGILNNPIKRPEFSIKLIDAIYSDWSDYSSDASTAPAAPSGIVVCKASSETSIYLEWEKSIAAKTYDLEYTTKKEYFDGTDQTTTVSGIEFTHYEKIGLETGQEYFFRVRAVNDTGSSTWSEVKSVIIGKKPAAPTTWSSTTTAITGEPLILYWVHNAEDNSSQTYAELEMYVDGVKETLTIKNSTDEEEKDKTSSYVVDTSKYNEGAKIQWRIRTAGVTMVYGEWSVQRTVDIYAPATLELGATDVNGNLIETLSSFPFYVSGLAGPKTQVPVGYYLSVIANETYETIDQIGNVKTIKAGDLVYSKYFDTSDTLLVEFSPSNIDLENNINYTIDCKVSMNSGLTAEAYVDFTVAWVDIGYEPNAEIGIDKNNLSASIRPYCEDENGSLIEDVMLSVYRREFDGSFVELARELNNTSRTFITDPHPALDYARYRIVAISKTTGAVSYYDVPGYPVGVTSVIVQWDEEWTSFDTTNEDPLDQPVWAGSLLILPYNIDVSDKHSPDVALVNYIGRSHPVSYYGTQVGASSTWNMEIEKSDKETLYALRRLALWMGDVYVREPSGSGYWANIAVSFSQKHCDLIIPVTLEIIRVEGGA